VRRRRIHPHAKKEIGEAEAFYEERSRGLGQSFADAVEAAVRRVQENPRIGHAALNEVRRYLVTGFPYAVFYLPEDDGIFVLAVAHQKRRPEYWARRLSR
jgi:toxin ParE1/3/4